MPAARARGGPTARPEDRGLGALRARRRHRRGRRGASTARSRCSSRSARAQPVAGRTDVIAHPSPATHRDTAPRAAVRGARHAACRQPTSSASSRGSASGSPARRSGWTVDGAEFRVDVAREIDLIEEVGRHWGLDRIPATFPALSDVPRPSAASASRARLAPAACSAGRACRKPSRSRSSTPPRHAATCADDDAVAITNPLSEKFAVMRPSLAPGLLESLTYNRNRQATDVRLFEIGVDLLEAARANGWRWAGSLTGRARRALERPDGRRRVHRRQGRRRACRRRAWACRSPSRRPPCPWLTRGQAAVDSRRRPARRLGGHARDGASGRRRRCLPVNSTSTVLGRAAMDVPRAIEPLPRFPTVVRDLSIVVDERLPAEKVRGTIRSNAPATLVHVREFDRYQGKGVPAGQVSLSVRLTFQHADRTLTDAEVQDRCRRHRRGAGSGTRRDAARTVAPSRPQSEGVQMSRAAARPTFSRSIAWKRRSANWCG